MRLSESEYHALLAMTGQPLPPDVQESRFLATVVRLARELGLVVHHHYDSRNSSPGWPDLAIVDPRPLGYVGPGGSTQASPDGTMRGMSDVLLVELKTARGKLTREQELWLRALDGKRVVTQVWRPGDMPEIIARLKGESHA